MYVYICIYTEAEEASKSWGAAWLLKFEKLPDDCSIWVVTVILEYFEYIWRGWSPSKIKVGGL